MTNWTCTKALQSLRISWPGVSENFCLTLYTSNDDSNLWEKCSFSSKLLVLFKNCHLAKLNQSCKIELIKTIIFGISTELTDLIFLLKIWEMDRYYTKCKNMKFERSWVKLRPNFVCLDNPRQNIWNKVKTSSKIGQV